MSDDQSPRATIGTSAVAEYPKVNVTMQQAYDLTMSVSFVPSRGIPGVLRLGCQPRQGAERVDEDPLDLPAPTHKWLTDVNKSVIAWLAADEKNQHAFVADPIAALQSAGIPIEREHLKALTRARESVGLSQAVTPGMQLRSIQTKASKSGQVKPVDSASTNWSPPRTRGDDCGCDDKGGR